MIIFRIRGLVREKETGVPLPGLTLKAFDKDLLFDDVLGSAVSGQLGEFEILSELADFKEFVETRPDIYFKVFDGPGKLIHTTKDAVRWGAPERSDSIVEIPWDRLHAAEAPQVVLRGDDDRVREEFAAGESLTIHVRGLRPVTAHEIGLRADGRELFTSRLLTNMRGEIEPTVLWPQMGLDDPNSLARYTIAEAQHRWGGRSVELTVAHGEHVVTASRLRFGEALAQPLVLVTDADGRILNGLEVGTQPLYVTVHNLPFTGPARIYLVAHQYDWNVGDPFTPAVWRTGRPAIHEVAISRGTTTIQVGEASWPLAGAYDVIVRPLRYGYEADEEHRLAATDVVGARRTTGVVIRENFWTAKPVLGGCVNKIAVSGRTVSGPPYFQFSDTFEVGEDVYAALDPGIIDPGNVSKMCAFYLIQNKTDAQWNADNSLNHLLGGNGATQKIKVQVGCVNANKILLWPGANAVGDYDIVVDFGNNTADAAQFQPNDHYDTPLDVIDGYFVAGFRVVKDPGTMTDPGLFAGSWLYDPAVVTGLGLSGTISVDDEASSYATAGAYSVLTRQVQLRANVYFPADSSGVTDPAQISSSKPDYPLVVIVHGNGQDYTTYDFVLQHLARNGFIAASIDNRFVSGGSLAHGMHGLGRANNFFKHLAVLKAKFGAKVQDNIGVLGHSRGGEAVVKVARLNQELALGNSINAVFSLAPTDRYGTEVLTAPLAGYFVLYGSRDGDVSGSGPYPGSGWPWRQTGFSLYDRASGMTKSMAFVYRATHNGFITDNTDNGDNPLPKETQRAITQAYANAFFRQHLRAEPQWAGMFTGEWRPASVKATGAEIYVQYRTPGGKTVDDFEAAVPDWQASSLGGSVSHAGVLPVDPVEGSLIAADPQSPQDTKGLKIRWDTLGDRLVWTIPPAHKHIAGFGTLSLRVAQKEGSPSNLAGQAQDFRVRLKDATGNERAIRASAFGAIPYPDQRSDAAQRKSALSTIRIPLSAYTIVCAGQPKVDLEHVVELSLEFSLKSTGEIDIDEIEFTS